MPVSHFFAEIEEADNRGYDVSKLIWVDQSRNIEQLGLEVERYSSGLPAE